jgi:hypothetical protein
VSGTTPRSPSAKSAVRPPRRARPHCRFKNRGTEYVSDSGIKWMGSSTKRQGGRDGASAAGLHQAAIPRSAHHRGLDQILRRG